MAAPALGQEGDEPVTVYDRPREGLEAKGVDLGWLRLFPSVTVSESYDDNIFAEDDNVESDFITTATAALVARSQWSRHEFQFDARVSHEKFLDNDEQDRTEYLLRPTLELDLANRSTARFSAEHSRRAVGRDDPEEDDDEEPTEFNRFAAEAEYIHRINRVFFGINGDVERDDYFTDGDDDRDRIQVRFGLPIGYEVSPDTDLSVEPFVRRRDYDTSEGADRDSSAAGALFGIDTEVTSLLDLNFDIGFVANDYDDSEFDNNVDLIFGGEAIWYVTPLTTVIGRAERRDIASTVSDSSSRTRTAVGVEVQHELLRYVLVGGGLQYLNDDFREIDRVDDRAVASLELEYLVNRYFSIVGDYQYEQRWSTEGDEDFSRNVVTVGLRARF